MAKKIKEISELPGVGDKTAEKLKERGYDTIMKIAASSPEEMEEYCEIGRATAVKFIQVARDSLDMGFVKAIKVDEQQKNLPRITTGSNTLNELLGGGIQVGNLYEVWGAFGSGKSQLAMQLAVNVQLPKEKGGLGKGCYFMDTEGTFKTNRVKMMANGLGLDPEEVLNNIYVARCYNSDHQFILLEKLKEDPNLKNIGLIVIDSIMSHLRVDFIGRGNLNMRQAKLNKHLHLLQKLSDLNELGVFMTNQVMSNPAILYGDPTVPTGGHVLGHATIRMKLRKSKGEIRIATMVDAPDLRDGECKYTVTDDGIGDVEEDKK